MELTPEAIADLYDRHAAAVFRRCRALLGDEQAALDATQDVFLRALRQREAFRGEASPSTWLYRITTNLCLNRLRDQRGRSQRLDRAGQEGRDGLEVGDGALFGGRGGGGAAELDRRILVRSLLYTVDEETRQVVVAFFFDGMTHEEICAVVGLSRPTVAKRLEQFRQAALRALGRGETALALGGVLALWFMAFVVGRG